jgi:release factor glutamine methyltransferase
VVVDVANPNVYPPKPASLLLAELSIGAIRPGERVLDACTGSGVVAVAIAKKLPQTIVVASDINPEAVASAGQNARRNCAAIATVVTDLYRAFQDDEFNTITVHPPGVPYPPNRDWGMTPGMRLATNGGVDGSFLISRSIIESKRCLKKGGQLLLLLPHWSNVKRAQTLLREHYSKVTELGRKRVEFFPAIKAPRIDDVIQYVCRLAKQGVIELECEGGTLTSTVSVIQAVKA